MAEGITDRWFLRFTRFGTTHIVRAQDGECACGIACAMMVCCRVNKWTTVADGMLSESKVYGKYDPSGNYDGTSYTYGPQLRVLLNSLNIGQWDGKNPGSTGVAAAIIDSATTFQLSTMPVIVHVKWDDGGAHFVMIDNVFNVMGTYYACVNDPWDGDVHVIAFKKGEDVIYKKQTPTYSFDLWGSRRKYSGNGQGKFSGFISYCSGMDVTSRLGKVFLSGNPM